MEDKKLEGEYIISWDNYFGYVESEGFVHNNLDHGIHTTYHENGKKRTMVSLDMGVRHGIFLEWREDGTKKQETWFEKGKEVGPHIEYFRNGRRKLIIHYKEGVLHGKWTFFHKNGRRKKETNYEDGEEVGLVRKWYKTGNIKYRGILRMKKLEGTFPHKWYVNEERWWNKDVKKSHPDQKGPIWENEDGSVNE